MIKEKVEFKIAEAMEIPRIKVAVLSFKELSYRIVEYCTFLFEPNNVKIFSGKCGAVNPGESVQEKLWCINPEYLKPFPTFKKEWPKILNNLKRANLIITTWENYSLLVEEVALIYNEYTIPLVAEKEKYNILFINDENPLIKTHLSIYTLADKLEVSTKEDRYFCQLVRENRYSPCFIRENVCSSLQNLLSGEEFSGNAILGALIMKRLFLKFLSFPDFTRLVLKKIKKENPFRGIS